MEAEERQRRARFSDMYAALYGRVRACATRRVGEEAAADVAAETFLIAWRRFDDVPEDSLPWLYGVARHVVLRHHSARARDQSLRSALELAGGAGELVGDVDERLWEAWAKLRETDREVLALVAWEQLRVRDAARVMGLSPAVFSVRLHRARKRLERLLDADQLPAPKPNSHVSEVS